MGKGRFIGHFAGKAMQGKLKSLLGVQEAVSSNLAVPIIYDQ